MMMKSSTLILFVVYFLNKYVLIQNHVVLKVKPNGGDANVCNSLTDSGSCQTLSYYTTQPAGVQMLNVSNAVNLTFLQGRYYPSSLFTETIHIRDKESLVLQGGEHSIVFGYRFKLVSIQSVIISNIKGDNVKISLDPAEDRPLLKYKHVTLKNCTFVKSDLIFAAVLLHIDSSTFTDNTLTSALTLYSSHVTFSGRVSFTNNNAVSGSALSLIESIVYVKGNCHVSFTNNSAEEVGGALFIDNTGKCFYIVDPGNCTIYFQNNKARHGGDHIYGMSLLETYSNIHSNLSSGRHTVLGTNWRSVITFKQPGLNDSLSAVSISCLPLQQ